MKNHPKQKMKAAEDRWKIVGMVETQTSGVTVKAEASRARGWATKHAGGAEGDRGNSEIGW